VRGVDLIACLQLRRREPCSSLHAGIWFLEAYLPAVSGARSGFARHTYRSRCAATRCPRPPSLVRLTTLYIRAQRRNPPHDPERAWKPKNIAESGRERIPEACALEEDSLTDTTRARKRRIATRSGTKRHLAVAWNGFTFKVRPEAQSYLLVLRAMFLRSTLSMKKPFDMTSVTFRTFRYTPKATCDLISQSSVF
jgi:hypothetical protein